MNGETNENCREPSRLGPWLDDWPGAGLETVEFCPVCGCRQRMKLYSQLVDNVFCTAPGRWTLYLCKDCGSSYLDPRPTKDFIHIAYRNYYTHKAPEVPTPPETLSVLRHLRRTFANGYLNWRYGTSLRPAAKLGIAAAWLMPMLRRRLDQKFRYLPRPMPGSRVLDVGFGSGAFLENAMVAGWEAVGVDPDAKAVANAGARGLNVRKGGVEAYRDEPGSFHAVTLSHVIEHVPDPKVVIHDVFRLLKPGGLLYLETPNIESLGHRNFGSNWLHLDPPRHLVIFCRHSILRVLEEAGFKSIRFLMRTNEYLHAFRASCRIANRQDPYGEDSQSPDWRIRLASLRGHLQPWKQEYLALVAIKGENNENFNSNGDL